MTLAAPTAMAAPRHHGVQAHSKAAVHGGVRFARQSVRGGRQALVSDGPGTGYGFHRLPYPYRAAAREQEDRQTESLRETVYTDALTSGGYGYGFLGDSVYGAGRRASYGVFNGSDGYGSPYFAGYYGPGDGEDFGPFGHAYTD